MGIDITGMSKAVWVRGRHSDELCDDEAHIPAGPCRKYLDGLKPGCYRCDGRSQYVHFTYGGLEPWQDALSMVIYGHSSGEVWANAKSLKGQPFIEILAVPDSNDVGFGPMISAKLYADFAKNARKVKAGFQDLALESVRRRRAGKKQPRRSKSHASNLVNRIAKAVGGMVVLGDDDPENSKWQWKWENYRDLRRAFRLAADEGILIWSM